MAAVDDFDQVIEQCQLALGGFVKGNPEPMQMIFSHQEDVTLANPFGPPVRGWEQVSATMERAASNFRDGEVSFEIVGKYSTPELAYVVEMELTMIFRPEEGTWKLVHRHADPIITAQPIESVLQE